MRMRVVGLVGLAVLTIAGVASVPALARPASVEPSSARPVPVPLVGLLIDECVEGLVFPQYVSVAVEPEGDRVRFVLERGASEIDPTAFPIVEFTPEEEAFREQFEACTSPHPVSLAEGLPDGERVDEAAYQEYRQRRLLPCLANHGVVVIESERGLDATRFGWYVASLYELPKLEQAVDAWYDCPALPPYLDFE
jgi:hypothetical protein